MFNMTWEEAQQAMREGKSVRNSNFTSDEWFQMVNGRIVCEQGYPMAGWYRGEEWQDKGWAIV